MKLSKDFTQFNQWKEFLEENPLLQVDLTNPVSSTDLVEGESYVFIKAPRYDDDDVPIHKFVFRKAELMGGNTHYTFEREHDGHNIAFEERDLNDFCLLYPYTEDVPCK